MVDEHGGLQRIVTQTDLLEAIAGDLPEASAPEVKEMEDGALLIDGAMSVYDAKVRLGLTESPDGNFNTFAGFVLSIFGRIPSVGERIGLAGLEFRNSRDRRVADRRGARAAQDFGQTFGRASRLLSYRATAPAARRCRAGGGCDSNTVPCACKRMQVSSRFTRS